MNEAAGALGMDATTYTDPSGFDPGTVSTAADQLRVFRRAMRFAAFRRIVSMGSVTLPVAGTLTNFNPLLDQGYARQDRLGLGGGRVPRLLHPGDGRRAARDRGRRGDGTGGGQRHGGAPRRGGRSGRAADAMTFSEPTKETR